MFSVTALSVVYRMHLPYVAKFLWPKILRIAGKMGSQNF